MTSILHTSLLLALVGQLPSSQSFDAVQAQRFLGTERTEDRADGHPYFFGFVMGLGRGWCFTR